MSSLPAASADPGRKVRLGLLIVFMVLVFVQFYLAGRGVFGAGSYDAHKAVGMAAQFVGLLILIATAAFPATRNGRDLGMAGALLVLLVIQGLIGNFDHPSLNAFHPFTALLIVGLGFHLITRDRAEMTGS